MPEDPSPPPHAVRADLVFTEAEVKLIYRLRSFQEPTTVQVVVQNGRPLFITVLARVELLTR